MINPAFFCNDRSRPGVVQESSNCSQVCFDVMCLGSLSDGIQEIKGKKDFIPEQNNQ